MESLIKEISIKEIDGVSIGNAQNDEAKTGVSVIYFKNGAQAGCDISGGGPASRETPLTSSMTADNPLNAVVLSGGSAFGLAASDGVMRCLEEHGIGYETGFAKVPLVCQSCIFDLGYGKSDVRPDADMGYEACVRALEGCDDSNGAQAGCDISGGGPASRETPLTSSMTADNPLNAVVLSGGSSFGLAASDGEMRCLEEHGIGFDTGFAKVPLVCQSCIFDLGCGKSDVRPDADMGYEACVRALEGCDDSMGNIGAGTGASVGKLLGMKQAMKSGLGVHAIQVGDLKIAAVVVVNAFGDIFDSSNARKIAGLMDPERKVFWDLEETFVKMVTTPQNLFKTNTTII